MKSELVDEDNTIGIDVLLIAVEAYTEALNMPESEHYTMSHYINDHIIIVDHFNELLSLLFKIEINPKTKDLITAEYIVQYIFSGENYTFAEYIATSRGVNTRKPRSCERGGVTKTLIVPVIYWE
jgi:hypothetical protein